jgi:hypothetical protein
MAAASQPPLGCCGAHERRVRRLATPLEGGWKTLNFTRHSLTCRRAYPFALETQGFSHARDVAAATKAVERFVCLCAGSRHGAGQTPRERVWNLPAPCRWCTRRPLTSSSGSRRTKRWSTSLVCALAGRFADSLRCPACLLPGPQRPSGPHVLRGMPFLPIHPVSSCAEQVVLPLPLARLLFQRNGSAPRHAARGR